MASMIEPAATGEDDPVDGGSGNAGTPTALSGTSGPGVARGDRNSAPRQIGSGKSGKHGARACARIASHIAALRPGRLTTSHQLARDLRITVPEVLRCLALLQADADCGAAWHRIVADGGAIGRHPWRDRQIARLRAEGVPVSPAGIVQDLAARTGPPPAVVADGATGAPGPDASARADGNELAGGAPSRARGRRDRPRSTC